MDDYITTTDIMQATGLTRGAINRYSSGDPRYRPSLRIAKVKTTGRRENLYKRADYEVWLAEWKEKNHAAGRPRMKPIGER